MIGIYMGAPTIADAVYLLEWREAYNSELWIWLNSPRAPNFDDFGASTFEDFQEEMDSRAENELRWSIHGPGGQTVGYAAFLSQSPICGIFHGVCIAPGFRNQGIGQMALRLITANLLARGYKKLIASFFADNEPVHRLFQSVGFKQEGLLTEATMRDLEPVDMRLMCYPARGVK